MGRDRVALFAAVREDHRQGMGIRAIARKHGVHRRTVREALATPVPAPRKVPERASPARDSVAPLIDAMLAEDLDAPRKQRHTARRVWCRLRDEHDAEVSYSYVAKYVARRRPEVGAEAMGQAESLQGYVPQAKEPGAEAEVDFGSVTVVLDGRDADCHLFAYRLSYSGMGVHRVYASCAQEALLEGHVTAFTVTGGVPREHIRYDNLTPAVTRVMKGRDRQENARWLSFRSWYGFDAFYCEPGIGGAHEKGGVEGEIGRFRRNFLVPVPRVKSLADLNARLAGDDLRDARRHVEFRPNTVAADFAVEAPLLRPLPADGFDTGTVLWPKADKFARISVGKCRYSVPARLIGTAVRVRLTASELTVFDGGKAVAVHPRLVASGAEHLVLDHYLEILARKPGALPGSVPLAQARADGSFTAAHEALWAQARRKLGDGAGTRALIEVLLLHRRVPAASVTAGIEAALRAGTCSPDVVAVEARRHAAAAGPAGPAEPAGPGPRRSRAAVITLPRRAEPLPADGRPVPDVAAYDQLLQVPPRAEKGGAS
jgi:transposase